MDPAKSELNALGLVRPRARIGAFEMSQIKATYSRNIMRNPGNFAPMAAARG